MWVSALGLALAVGGGVVVARVAADTPADGRARVVSAEGGSGPGGPGSLVVEPRVRFEGVDPGGSAGAAGDRGVYPRAHRHRGVPVRLVVPVLGVDVPVVGIDAPGGVLLPPGDPQVLGWWRSGAVPGARVGSALVTGHTVSSGGGAFDDLDTLGRGDVVRVRTGSGSIRYVVSGVRVYRKASLARDAKRVFSQSVPGRLVLITCEDWNGSTYLSNAVVIAERRD